MTNSSNKLHVCIRDGLLNSIHNFFGTLIQYIGFIKKKHNAHKKIDSSESRNLNRQKIFFKWGFKFIIFDLIGKYDSTFLLN